MSKYKALCQCEHASYTHLALLQFRLEDVQATESVFPFKLIVHISDKSPN